jgi:hypothetical protein
MLSATRRIWIVALLGGASMVGCAFGGASGSPDEEPEPGQQMPDAGAGGTPAKACAEFIEIEGSRYSVLPVTLPWSEARERCKQIPRAHLATFESAEEAGRVASGIPVGVDVWTAVVQSPTFYGFGGQTSGWANLKPDDEREDLPDSFPWRSGEPNDGNSVPFEDNAENHGVLRPDGLFDDANRGGAKPPLCECEEE